MLILGRTIEVLFYEITWTCDNNKPVTRAYASEFPVFVMDIDLGEALRGSPAYLFFF